MNRVVKYIIYTLAIFQMYMLSARNIHARIESVNDFSGAHWNKVMDYRLDTPGWLQSMCVTDKYIVFGLNSKENGDNDTLLALHKEPDKKGEFQKAFSVTDHDYEHINGMTYNPITKEIYITTGFTTNPSNSGCIFAVDADTLTYKRTISVTKDGTCFSAISYDTSRNQYVIQTDSSNQYSFYVADENFDIKYSFNPSYLDGAIFYQQDLCVSEDYIFSVSHYSLSKSDNYITVYSLLDQSKLCSYYINLSDENTRLETEGIAELSPGRFLLASATSWRKIRISQTTLPTLYTISTTAQNGSISKSNQNVPGNNSYTVNFSPNEHYRLSKLEIDGRKVKDAAGLTEYTFQNVDADHTVSVYFEELPKYKINTKALNGSISKPEPVYEDDNCKVSFKPDKHYELEKILLDGQELEIADNITEYTFYSLHDNHELEVVFKEIASFNIETDVSGGQISKDTQKVYYGESSTISFLPDTDNVLIGVMIDGKWLKRKGDINSYTFINVSSSHTIKVVYMWKYLPLVSIASICAVIVVPLQTFRTVKNYSRKKHSKKLLQNSAK